MSSNNLLEIPKVIDLAFGTPEIGVVNFNILHALLHLMVGEIFNLEQNRIELIQKLDGTVQAILHDHIKSQHHISDQINSIMSINPMPSKESNFSQTKKKVSITVLPTSIQVGPQIYELFSEEGLKNKDMVIWNKNEQMESAEKQKFNAILNESQSVVKISERKMEAELEHEASKKNSPLISENLASKSESIIQKLNKSETVSQNSNQEFKIKNSPVSQSKTSSTRSVGIFQETIDKSNTMIRSTAAISQIENIPISELKTSVPYVNETEENTEKMSAISKSKISVVSDPVISQINDEDEGENSKQIEIRIIKAPKEHFKFNEFIDDTIKKSNESLTDDNYFQNKIPMNFVLNESSPQESPIELIQANEDNNSNSISQINFKETIIRENGGKQDVEELNFIENNNFNQIYDENRNNETKIFFTKSHFHYNQTSVPIRQKAGQDKDPNSSFNDEDLAQSDKIITNELAPREKAGLTINTKNGNENDMPLKDHVNQLPLNDSQQPKKETVCAVRPASGIPTDVNNFNLLSKSLESRVDKVEHVVKSLNVEVIKNFKNINDRLNNLPTHSLEHINTNTNFQEECTLVPLKLNALIGGKKSTKDEETNFKEEVRQICNDLMKEVNIRRGLEEGIRNSTPQQSLPNKYFDNKFEELILKNVELNEYIKELEKEMCQLKSILLDYINSQKDKELSGQMLIELQNEIKELKDFSDNVIKELAVVRSEREEFKMLTDSIKKNLEFLNIIKLDKEEIDQLLLDKADTSMLDRKLSIESYLTGTAQMEATLKKKLDHVDSLYIKLGTKLQTFNDQLIKKLGQPELEELKEWVEKKLLITLGGLNKPASGGSGGRASEAAGTTIRYLKNVDCLSCQRNVFMRKDEKIKVPLLNKAHLSSSPKAELAYKLDNIRTEIKKLPISRNLNDFNVIMKKNQPKNRFCGGSHTKISIKDANEAGIGQGSATETTKDHENLSCTCKN